MTRADGMRPDEYDRLPFKRVGVDGGEMFTIDAGDGDAVVLVHGSPVCSLEFRAVLARLLTRFRVVAPDLLAFGRSTGPADGAGFTQQATALRGLLDALELQRFHLVVHDWGGPIGLAATARKPDQLDRLVLINTPIRPSWRPPLYWRPMSAPRLGEAALVHANLFSRGLPLLLRAVRRDRELRARYTEPLRRVETRLTILRLERLDGYAAECRLIERELGHMPGSKLIVWGQPDPTLRGELKRLRALLPGAQVVELRGAGHFVTDDAPGRAADAISSFLPDPE